MFNNFFCMTHLYAIESTFNTFKDKFDRLLWLRSYGQFDLDNTIKWFTMAFMALLFMALLIIKDFVVKAT